MDYDIGDFVVFYKDEQYEVGQILFILIGKFDILYFIEGLPYTENEILPIHHDDIIWH